MLGRELVKVRWPAARVTNRLAGHVTGIDLYHCKGHTVDPLARRLFSSRFS